MIKTCVIFGVFLLSTAAYADTNPFRIVAHEVRDTGSAMIHDTRFAVVSWTYVGAYAADEVTTAKVFSRCPGCYETGPLANHSRSMGRIAGEWGAVTFANIVISHVWRAHVHNRFLNGLWAGGMAYQTEEHIAQVPQNMSWPPPRP